MNWAIIATVPNEKKTPDFLFFDLLKIESRENLAPKGRKMPQNSNILSSTSPLFRINGFLMWSEVTMYQEIKVIIFVLYPKRKNTEIIALNINNKIWNSTRPDRK